MFIVVDFLALCDPKSKNEKYYGMIILSFDCSQGMSVKTNILSNLTFYLSLNVFI
jgi:hypothetical protein